jgi:HlyD family secretion protein
MTAPQSLAGISAALPDAWQSTALPAPPRLRALLAGVAALLLTLFVLAATVPIDSAVIAGGQVVVHSQVRRIAHPLGGVVAQIFVRNGQHVAANAVLLRLDDRVSGADAHLSELTYEQLLAQKARLDAERLGRATIVFPAELARSRAAEVIADEQHVFDLRQAETMAMRAQLVARIAQDNAAIRGLEAQIAATREQRRLIEREREGVRELWERQLVTASRMYQLDRAAADLGGTIGSLQAQIAQTRARIAEARQQAIQLGQTRRLEAGNVLGQVQAALGQQDLRRISSGDSHDRNTIRAGVAGTVEKLGLTAVGTVVRPAEPIMEIVPDHEALEIEAMINPVDIDHVRPGQRARVRFSGFSRAATPELPGTVTYVAADRSESAETRQAFYVVRVALDPSALGRANLDLKSGMPAQVQIAGGSRTMLSYLSKPLRDQFVRAFRAD